MHDAATGIRLGLCQRQLVAPKPGAICAGAHTVACTVNEFLLDRATGFGLGLRQRQLAAAEPGAVITVAGPAAPFVEHQLFDRQTSLGLGLRERRLVTPVARAIGAGADIPFIRRVYDRAAGVGLDLRERGLGAAIPGVSDDSAGARLEVRQR
jgi:hypothetical protein